MSYLADLHTHSTVSDGQYPPGELVRLAKERGIEVLALTDHDTIDGVEEAVAAGCEAGVRVLRGVELSAEEYPNLHILGYNFPGRSPVLCGMSGRLKAERNQRKYRIRDFLLIKGIDVPLDEVEAVAAGGVIGRPHFAQVMLRHGYVSSRKEAFDRYLDTEEYQAYDKGTKPSVQTCIETVRKAGGKASLAHPYQIVLGDKKLENLVRKLVEYGLDAIECYYPKHTPEQQAEYLHYAKKYGLHVTGGSDFHGEKNKPDHPLAAVKLDLDWLL